MKVCLAAFALTAIAWLPLPAHAIDCARASRPIEHMICGSQELLRADTTMSRAYAAILTAAPNPDIHAMLVTSQRRWIAALDLAFADLDKASEDRTGGDFIKAKQRGLILDATLSRTKDLTAVSGSDPKQLRLIGAALRQQRFAAQFTGGPYAGFQTKCSFLPRNGNNPGYDYACLGTVQYQNIDRICGRTEDWATFRVYTSGHVGNVVDGRPRLLATCKDDGCSDGASLSGSSGWDTKPSVATDGIIDGPLVKLDAEADDQDDRSWLTTCLRDKNFPVGSPPK